MVVADIIIVVIVLAGIAAWVRFHPDTAGSFRNRRRERLAKRQEEQAKNVSKIYGRHRKDDD